MANGRNFVTREHLGGDSGIHGHAIRGRSELHRCL